MHDLAQRSAEIAASKGFDKPTWENLPTKLMFVVTEIDEVCEAMTLNESDHDIGEELADIAIRTLVMLETLWPTWTTGRLEHRTKRYHKHAFAAPEVMLWPMIRYARSAMKHWRNDERTDTQQCLELLLLELWRLSDRLSLNLLEYIDAKIAKNAERPMRNGKVRSEG